MNRDSMTRFHELMKKIRMREAQYKKRYGAIKPIMHASLKGTKFVAIGNEVHYSKEWKTFPDFLLTYIWSIFGKDWGENELKKDPQHQHEVVKWWIKTREFMAKQKPNKSGLCESPPNGPFKAILLLSYDLYLIRHHQQLQDLVKSRLKDLDQFQGARYELFALASCIRAGFNIEFEDELGRVTKHTEFTAIHTPTGEKISIEAKSKHRSGILGYKIEKGLDEKIKLKVVRLINQALKKKSQYPLVVFIDTNLPQDNAAKIYSDREFREFKKVLDRVPKNQNGEDIFNLIIFTNTPHYYGGQELENTKKHFSYVFAFQPETKISNQFLLHRLNRAVSLYGNIPNEFPEDDRTF